MALVKVTGLADRFVKGDALPRLAGAKGVRRRWAKATPAERAEAADRMNRARLAKYVERAHAEAASRGVVLDEYQALVAANAMWQADLADRRLLAWHKRQEAASE
jgi:hypothetical protein